MHSSSLFIDIHSHHDNRKEETIQVLNRSLWCEWDNAKWNSCRRYSIGIHPYEIDSKNFSQIIEYINECLLHPQVVAIGECGLDARLTIEMERQEEVFLLHKNWAEKVRKPLLIHCVKAHHLLFPLVNDVRVPLIFHGVNVRWNIMKSWTEKGAFLSFGSALFRENPSTVQTFIQTPLSQIFFETDDDSFEIKLLYEKAARWRNISTEELKLQVQKNFSTVFLIQST